MRLGGPSAADEFVGREALQGLEVADVVVGVEKRGEVTAEIPAKRLADGGCR
jgi:hypothetical protein